MDATDGSLPARRRGESTNEALAEIARFLASVPGRKNLIWLASSFDADIFRSQDQHLVGRFDNGTLKELRRVADLLSLSNTAVYPVDAAGVRAIVGYSTYGIGENVGRIQMDILADNTGGHAFYGTNDLREAMDKAIVNGSTYYSLTYEPTNPKYDGSLRHIKVTLKKSGYNLAYRRTYYADDLAAVAHAAADAPESPLTPALERGTPLAHGLFVEAHLEVQGIPVAATPAQMQVLSQYEAMRNHDQKPTAKTTPVTMQQYVISYGLIARQLDLPADDSGTRKAALEFGVISYDEDGRKLNGLDSHVEESIPPARYEKLAAEGYRAVQTIAIPVTAASLRLAVRDIQSNRTGSLEVRLPLATASLANPAK